MDSDVAAEAFPLRIHGALAKDGAKVSRFTCDGILLF